MNNIVAELAALVGGSSTKTGFQSSSSRSSSVEHGLSTSDHTFHNIAGGSRNTVSKQPVTRTIAENAIPLDNSDGFNNFNS